jgi:signal transduction histidine kinase
MLGALREADRAPAPGLADLDRLAAATTAAGVHVDVRWRGEPGAALPPEIDLSAFRIIQESVTNVVRHAGTGSCRVTVDCRQEGELSIEVTDDGRGRGGTPGPAGTPGAVGAPATTATGYGLIGMRERVSLLHGDFSARPRPEGGFRVAARLPVPVPEGAR